MHTHRFPRRSGRPRRSLLLALTIAVSCAAANELPPFTPHSPASASRPGPVVHADGETIYRAICQGCHMPDARGAAGAGRYPSLAEDAKLASATFTAARVIGGGSGMPRFADMLDDAQVVAVVTYVRTHFGNAHPDALTRVDVERLRMALVRAAQ